MPNRALQQTLAGGVLPPPRAAERDRWASGKSIVSKSQGETGRSYIGIASGVAIGCGIGIALGNWAFGIGPGIAIGVALGLAFGGKHAKAAERSSEDQDDNP